MQNAPLFHVLLDHLESIDASSAEIARFIDRWHQLKSHEGFPCPVCYLRGEDHALTLLAAQPAIQPMLCPACETLYNVPIED
ncbi:MULTISPECIES: hypothetical protein [unclassified Paraburkholderia]|jgi:hypothetical protein|uniref:hypothetical protein n=1 Tax=unclassified Paraburkholderia TaxID=2615204 RepID=UPI0038B86E4C